MKQGKTDAVVVAQRAAEATKLRTAGATYQQIADHMGYSDRSAVRQLILSHANRELRESVDEMRQIGNERLDIVVARMVGIIGARDKTDLAAIRASETLIRAEARRAALNGLDRPISVQVMSRAQSTLAELSELVMNVVVASNATEPLALEAS